MPGINSLNNQVSSQALYFAASQSAAQQQAAEQAKQSSKTQKRSFTSSLKRLKEEAELSAAGLPKEIAGMQDEEALIFLKDSVDIASDQLKNSQTPENIENFRTKIGQFMKFVVRNNFEIIQKRRIGKNRRTGRPLAPYYQIQVINQKVNNLASDMLYNNSRNLNILARIEEINGLIVDLMAA